MIQSFTFHRFILRIHHQQHHQRQPLQATGCKGPPSSERYSAVIHPHSSPLSFLSTVCLDCEPAWDFGLSLEKENSCTRGGSTEAVMISGYRLDGVDVFMWIFVDWKMSFLFFFTALSLELSAGVGLCFTVCWDMLQPWSSHWLFTFLDSAQIWQVLGLNHTCDMYGSHKPSTWAGF